MPTLQAKHIITGIGALLVLIALVVAFRPRAVGVDVALVTAGPMSVTVDEEARTRIREVYTVSAPIAGRLRRIGLDAGDVVIKGVTPVAVIEPAAPPLLDERTRAEVEAQIEAAKAGVELAGAEVKQAQSELTFAESELNRARQLVKSNVVSERQLERARIDVETKTAALGRARANLEVRAQELQSIRARLIGPDGPAPHAGALDCCITVKAPVDGRVLRLVQESERIVLPGTPLIEIGDPADLEIVAELLSVDAVRIAEGARVAVEGWGRPAPLTARVRRIEPTGFTKVSALGIEEQRVRVLLDFEGDAKARAALGHDYRVFVRIEAWRSDKAVRVPLAALFREAGRWAVFRSDGGRARLAIVDIGQRNTENAEVLAGLKPGDRILLHPSDKVSAGVRIAERPAPPAAPPAAGTSSARAP